jgi:hypothetical protein
VNINCPLPRPAIILSTYPLQFGVSGHFGRDRSTILWRTDPIVDVLPSHPTQQIATGFANVRP